MFFLTQKKRKAPPPQHLITSKFCMWSRIIITAQKMCVTVICCNQLKQRAKSEQLRMKPWISGLASHRFSRFYLLMKGAIEPFETMPVIISKCFPLTVGAYDMAKRQTDTISCVCNKQTLVLNTFVCLQPCGDYCIRNYK